MIELSNIISEPRKILSTIKERFEKENKETNRREEFVEAEDAINEALAKVSEDLPKEKEVQYEVKWSDDSDVAEHMGGAIPRCETDSEIEITVNPGAEKWQISVLNATVHGYAHAYYYEKTEFQTYRTWNLILEEAFALLVEEWMITEYESAWWRREFSKENLGKYWERMKQELDRKRSSNKDPQYLTENGVNALYPLCYMIGEELFQEHHIEDFHEIGKQEVIEAGDKLFN